MLLFTATMSLRDSSSKRREKDSSHLRMDTSRISRSNKAASPPKRKELDKVMKKARSRDGANQANYWNKKLLEVEEKDPNRWRHSGYKELYGGANGSPNGSRGSKQSSRSRSRVARGRARSPVKGRDRSRDKKRRPHTPQPTTSRVASNKAGTSRQALKPISRSASSRSLSSCSDESCSVCSPKPRANPKKPVSPMISTSRQQVSRSRSRSFSVPRSKGPPAPRKQRHRSSPPRDPRGPPPSPPPRGNASRQSAPRVKGAPGSKKRKSHSSKSGRSKRRAPATPILVHPPRHSSPAAMSGSDESSSSIDSSNAPPKLTLSERFGKMAQWSVDRRDLDGIKNMRITKDSDSSDLKVVIEDARYRALSPMPANDRRVGAGYYPEALHSAPTGLEAWDDVRVRYKYYKDRGYLRDLTLDDYMKWEEWWYKYQEWLEAERYYERWDAIRAEQANKIYYNRGKRAPRRAREFQ